MYFARTPFPRCGYSVHFPLEGNEEQFQADSITVNFEGSLPGARQDINRAELFAVMMLLVSVTNFNVQWYSDSKSTIQGMLRLLQDPVEVHLAGRSNEDMWVIAAEIVAHFKRFFEIDCRYVPAHVEAEEVGSRISRFEFLENEAADHAAKKGARTHPDFLQVQSGLVGWKEFEGRIERQILDREEAHHRLLEDG